MKQKDLENFIPQAYAELRRLAAYHMRNERPGHTLRPTDLVHEVYLRLQKQHSLNLSDRAGFMSLASTMMRRILVNHARRRNRLKRGSGLEHAELDEFNGNSITVHFGKTETDLIALDEALGELARRDPRQVKIVEYHFFGGLTFDEIAGLLDISLSTVMREWRMARNWLFLKLNSSG